MRKKIVAGNWKMNTDKNSALELYQSIVGGAQKGGGLDSVLIFPPFPFIDRLSELEAPEFVGLGSQNIAMEANGAYTGEVSASMIKSMGVHYTLVGHSERRTYFGEDGDVLRKKVDLALENGLTPVFCCGEQLEDRKSARHEAVISRQLEEAVFHLDASSFAKLIIAYEPVWAIGTGETATSEQAESMHAFIRRTIEAKYNADVAADVKILYGGSCKADNAGELFACQNVDGGLIGGASLKAEEFLKIIEIAND